MIGRMRKREERYPFEKTDESLLAVSERLLRFRSRIRKGPGCWIWLGSNDGGSGYGSVQWRGKMRKAHRVAYEIAHGAPPPDHLDVCHHCDNPPCCRPSHLFVGTVRDNLRDAYAKGRIKCSPAVIARHKQLRDQQTC